MEAPDEPHPRFEGEDEVFKKIAETNGVKLGDLKKGRPRELWVEAINEAAKNPETSQYKEWEKKNSELHQTVSKLLSEFYQDRPVDEDTRLKLEEDTGLSFEISSEKEALLKLMEGNLTPEEKENLVKKLPKRREEMSAFTEFLKNKFFNELGDKAMQEKSEREFKEYVKDLHLTEEDLVKVNLGCRSRYGRVCKISERKGY